MCSTVDWNLKEMLHGSHKRRSVDANKTVGGGKDGFAYENCLLK